MAFDAFIHEGFRKNQRNWAECILDRAGSPKWKSGLDG
jgi:hypothetical protein